LNWSRQQGQIQQGTSEKTPLEGLKMLGTVPDFSLILSDCNYERTEKERAR